MAAIGSRTPRPRNTTDWPWRRLRFRGGVVCLVSALSFHGIGRQLPHEVWIALDRRDRRPSLRYPRLRVLRFGGAALTEGIETHRLEDEEVRIYSPAKTVADAFKYRNKIGLEQGSHGPAGMGAVQQSRFRIMMLLNGVGRMLETLPAT